VGQKGATQTTLGLYIAYNVAATVASLYIAAWLYLAAWLLVALVFLGQFGTRRRPVTAS